MTDSIKKELVAAGQRSDATSQAAKKNYAEALSRALATRFANELRGSFEGILPDVNGIGHETRARSSKGYKKLDVNYSTIQLGLGLGVSVKTINFRDAASGRYTKNYTRADGELRAEASDYHIRQPYAVMIAVIFLPLDACDDGTKRQAGSRKKETPSSFGQAVQIFRSRAGRKDPDDEPMLFERVFIGLYDVDPATFGDVIFFDVNQAPPKQGKPKVHLGFADLTSAITATYDQRNSPPFMWAEGDVETVIPESIADEGADEEDE